MVDINWIAVSVALGAATVGAVTDIWKHRVYNTLTIPLFFAGIVYHTATTGLGGLWLSLLGAGVGSASGMAQIPEPTSALLLVMGAMAITHLCWYRGYTFHVASR